jgi:DNA-binding XRE family transcriptional regulator
MIAPVQAHLHWTQDNLSKTAEISVKTFCQFESEKFSSRNATLTVPREAFEAVRNDSLSENRGASGVLLRACSQIADIDAE